LHISKKSSTFVAENVILWQILYAKNVILLVFLYAKNVI